MGENLSKGESIRCGAKAEDLYVESFEEVNLPRSPAADHVNLPAPLSCSCSPSSVEALDPFALKSPKSPSSPGSLSSIALEDGTLCQTVIVFDWDDTLLCSSAINAQQWSQMQLALLERAVQSILETAMALGETIIVTNGISSWVLDSSRRFLPKLVPILERLQVHSARSKYESYYPGDPMTWKRQAFRDIFSRRRVDMQSPSSGRTPDSTPSSVSSVGMSGFNMVVLGDSFAEIEAARAAGRLLGKSSLVKTVKFKEGPSVNELVGQLRRMALDLGQVVQQAESVHRNLVLRPLPAHLDYLSSWASGWKFSEERASSFYPDSVYGG